MLKISAALGSKLVQAPCLCNLEEVLKQRDRRRIQTLWEGPIDRDVSDGAVGPLVTS
jgi:hypothetical protein